MKLESKIFIVDVLCVVVFLVSVFFIALAAQQEIDAVQERHSTTEEVR